MKNLKIKAAVIFASVLTLSSCIEHEVIPAPEPKVDLSCHFIGTINGTGVEFTQNVSGYDCITEKTKIILPAPQYSSAVYYSQIASTQSAVAVKIGMGSVYWDASTVNDPTLALFNDFFLNNLMPSYSDLAASGIEIQYRDGTGKIWASKQSSPNSQNAVFSNLKQESDNTGDYSKFTCNFSCYVYNYDNVALAWDSLQIQNAVFSGWFKR